MRRIFVFVLALALVAAVAADSPAPVLPVNPELQAALDNLGGLIAPAGSTIEVYFSRPLSADAAGQCSASIYDSAGRWYQFVHLDTLAPVLAKLDSLGFSLLFSTAAMTQGEARAGVIAPPVPVYVTQLVLRRLPFPFGGAAH